MHWGAGSNPGWGGIVFICSNLHKNYRKKFYINSRGFFPIKIRGFFPVKIRGFFPVDVRRKSCVNFVYRKNPLIFIGNIL